MHELKWSIDFQKSNPINTEETEAIWYQLLDSIIY